MKIVLLACFLVTCLLVIGAGCRDGAESSTATTSTWSPATLGDGGKFATTLETHDGSQVRKTRFNVTPGIDATFHWGSRIVTVSKDTAKARATSETSGLIVNGGSITIEDGELRIGSESFGDVGESSAVDIGPDGVVVDGERRGSLR